MIGIYTFVYNVHIPGEIIKYVTCRNVLSIYTPSKRNNLLYVEMSCVYIYIPPSNWNMITCRNMYMYVRMLYFPRYVVLFLDLVHSSLTPINIMAFIVVCQAQLSHTASPGIYTFFAAPDKHSVATVIVWLPLACRRNSKHLCGNMEHLLRCKYIHCILVMNVVYNLQILLILHLLHVYMKQCPALIIQH